MLPTDHRKRGFLAGAQEAWQLGWDIPVVNWLQLLSCLAQELVREPMSEALPPEVLEEDIGVFLVKTTLLPIPTQISAASKIPKKTSHRLLEVIDFIPTTTGLEHTRARKERFI